MASSHIEEKIQAQCFQWFWNTFPEERQMLFHVDNNSWNEVIGARKKALGVCKGVADFVFILPWGKIVFIEMKKPGGKQSESQKDFMNKVQDRQHYYHIIDGFEEFKQLINTLLDG